MKSLLSLLRPQQWVKNLFCFFPVFFGGQLGDSSKLIASAIAFVAFSLIASSIYCFNDIFDVKADRQHPVKRNRPVASGAVSVPAAYGLMAAMALLACGVCFLLPSGGLKLLSVIGLYFILNIAYCVWLKRKPLIDVTIISFGFVLRVVAGGVATGIVLSHWIIIMTFLLALFLALAKRRDDVALYASTGKKMRAGITRYNLAFMNQAIAIVATITLVAYIMYTVSDEVTARLGNDNLYITFIFVLLGILRYLQLAIVDQKTGSPTKVLLHDRFIQACVAGWVISFAALIYIF